MQSDGNNSWEDVVLDSFNMPYKYKNSILVQKYEKEISCDLYYADFKF